MARKTKKIKLTDRDNVHEFIIEEMPATQLERWIHRAGIAVAGAGTTTSLETLSKGGKDQKEGAALEAIVSLIGGLDYDKAKVLMDEMLGCCSRVSDKFEERCTPESVDMYIEDVATLFKLRWEALSLNFDFLSKSGLLSGFLANLNTGQISSSQAQSPTPGSPD